MAAAARGRGVGKTRDPVATLLAPTLVFLEGRRSQAIIFQLQGKATRR